MKNKGTIRNNFVKESLLEYNDLANTLNENTKGAVTDLLAEMVRNEYKKFITEGDEDEFDVEEVDDTDSVDANEDDSTADDAAVDGMESDADVEADGAEDETSEETLDVEDDATDVEATADGEGEGWSEFDKYKVSDEEYDFSNAEDEDIVKVYKLLKDDDQVVVSKTDDKVSITDNETGAEYLIDLGNSGQGGSQETLLDVEVDDTDDAMVEGDDEFGDTEETDFENQGNEDMNESRLFEIALNEYNSNVGYTDNYQSKDVMTNPGTSEPGKNVNDWDKGVPHDGKKPWSGKKNDKSENQPFTAEKGKTVEEETELEEGTNVGGYVQQNSVSKSHVSNANGRSARSASKGGSRVKGTADPRYSDSEATNEAIKRKAEKIFAENKQLKTALLQFKKTLQEAAITNVNLGNIIKLVMENTTTTDEKKEIIERFGGNIKTVEDSKNLYEDISRELKRKQKMNIDESKEYTVGDNKQINETQIYRSNDLMESLDLMHKICK